MNKELYSKGTLIHVISPGPFDGHEETIRSIERIGAESDRWVVFYFVVLHEESGKELWLEHDAVLAVFGTSSGL